MDAVKVRIMRRWRGDRARWKGTAWVLVVSSLHFIFFIFDSLCSSRTGLLIVGGGVDARAAAACF
jgi:hypothetical protein